MLFPRVLPPQLTFVDLFAGIGGTRLAFESAGARCVFTSEMDRFARETYAANFGDEHIAGDIRLIDADEIPGHDILVGGFPCQPFSIAGVSKKNSLGRAHGFECKTQGTLFFEIERILRLHRPRAFLLENVKNLISHDGGRTWRVILNTLQTDLEYDVSYRVVDARCVVPQHRERIFLVGVERQGVYSNLLSNLTLPDPDRGPRLRTILHPEDGSETPELPFTEGASARVAAKYVLGERTWQGLLRHAEHHRALGNGFGYGLVGPNDVARTLSARYHKDGSEILVRRGPGERPRRLTPRECARLMGFPSEWKIPVSDTQAYRQFGNSVVVPIVAAIAEIIAAHLSGNLQISLNYSDPQVQGELFSISEPSKPA